MTWWNPWTWRNGRDIEGVRDAQERLARAIADDSTVDELHDHNRRIMRENGFVQDIERALRRRTT